MLLQVAKMQMIELREEPGHLIALRHVACDLVTACVIVDMSVSIDNFHRRCPPKFIEILFGRGLSGVVIQQGGARQQGTLRRVARGRKKRRDAYRLQGADANRRVNENGSPALHRRAVV